MYYLFINLTCVKLIKEKGLNTYKLKKTKKQRDAINPKKRVEIIF